MVPFSPNHLLVILFKANKITYYRIRNKRLRKTVVSILSCRALERSNNPYIESLVEPCVSKNQKEMYAMWV